MTKGSNDQKPLALRVGPLRDLNAIVQLEKRIIRAMARGKISLADGERLCRAARELRLGMQARDVEKSVQEAKSLLEEVKSLRGAKE